jgi:hypothetical protein
VVLPDRPAATGVPPPPAVPTVHIGVVEVRVLPPAPPPAPPPVNRTRPPAPAAPARISQPAGHFGIAQG